VFRHSLPQRRGRGVTTAHDRHAATKAAHDDMRARRDIWVESDERDDAGKGDATGLKAITEGPSPLPFPPVLFRGKSPEIPGSSRKLRESPGSLARRRHLRARAGRAARADALFVVDDLAQWVMFKLTSEFGRPFSRTVVWLVWVPLERPIPTPLPCVAAARGHAPSERARSSNSRRMTLCLPTPSFASERRTRDATTVVLEDQRCQPADGALPPG
jgi:hypothetical protein